MSVWPTSTPAPTQAFLQGQERGEQGAGKGLRKSKRIGEGQLGVREESPGAVGTCALVQSDSRGRSRLGQGKRGLHVT